MNLASKPQSTKKTKTGGWRTYKPETNLDTCIGCGTCHRVCPENAIIMRQLKGKPKPKTNFDYCKGCGICATECPVKAIKMELEEK